MSATAQGQGLAPSLQSSRHLFRATLLTALTMLAVMALGTYLAVRQAKESIAVQVQANRVNLASGLGLALVEPLAIRDYGTLEARLSQVMTMASLRSARAVAPDGALLAHVVWVDGQVQPVFDQLQFERPSRVEVFWVDQADGGALVWYPIQVGSLLGWLALEFTPDSGDAALEQLLERILLLAGLGGLLMFGAFLLIMRRTHQMIASHEQGLHAKNVDLHSAARQDPLTGLINRAGLTERLTSLLHSAAETQERFAVCFLDLDRFKPINDVHGHDVGDQVLRVIADRILACSRHADTSARIGGDEFVLVVRGVEKSEDLDHVLQRLIHQICEPIVVQGIEARLGVSIGVSLYPDQGQSEADLLDLADQAMYVAKRSGGQTWRLYGQID